MSPTMSAARTTPIRRLLGHLITNAVMLSEGTHVCLELTFFAIRVTIILESMTVCIYRVQITHGARVVARATSHQLVLGAKLAIMQHLRSIAIVAIAASAASSFGVSTDEIVTELKKAETSLGPASGHVRIINDVPFHANGAGPDQFWGYFTFEASSGRMQWSQHFSEQDMLPQKGARTEVYEATPKGMLWYEVVDSPRGPGIGSISLDHGTSVSPMLGRAFRGTPLSKVVADLKNVEVRESGSNIIVTGNFKPEVLLSLSFEPRKGWMATHGILYSNKPNAPSETWEITKTSMVGRTWCPIEASLTTKFSSLEHRTSTLVYSDLLPMVADRSAFPRPIEGSLLGGPESTTYKLSSDGTMSYFEKREKPHRKSIAWNLMFVLSGALLLVVSLAWLVLSRRRAR